MTEWITIEYVEKPLTFLVLQINILTSLRQEETKNTKNMPDINIGYIL